MIQKRDEFEPFIPDHLPREGHHGRKDLRYREVHDPNEPLDTRKKIVVAVNINRDVLEFELGHGRITKQAYAQGRLLQTALELRGGSGQSQWSEGDKVDAGSLVALAIARNLDRARMAVSVIEHCHFTLGKRMGAHVVLCLREPRTWPDITALYGEQGERAERYYARLFRDGLECLAEHPA